MPQAIHGSVLVLAMLWVAVPVYGIAKRGTQVRPTVVVFWLEDRTADLEADHWRYTVRILLTRQLKKAKEIRVLPAGPVEFAFRRMGISAGAALDGAQARRMGELIEVEQVVWGSYQRERDKWLASVRVLDVARGEASDTLSAASTDWFEVRDRLTEQILAELRVTPLDDERKELARRWTTSAAALRWYSKSRALQRRQAPLSEREEYLRKAIAADPRSASFRESLAAVLGSQGKMAQAAALVNLGRFQEALECLNRALDLTPDYAEAWSNMSWVLGKLRRFQEALECSNRALELKPDHSQAWVNKGAALAESGQLEEALECLDRVVKLKPDDPVAWLNKGKALYRLERFEEAKRILEQATRLGSPLARQLLESLDARPRGEKAVKGRALTSQQKQRLEERDGYVKRAGKYEADSNFVEALRCRREALEIATEVYGENDWRVTDARLDIEDLKRRSHMSGAQRDRLEESERLGDQSANLWREKPEQALPLARRAMEIRGNVLGMENRDYIESVMQVAKLYKVLEDFPRAQRLYRKALETRGRVLGEKHPDYARGLKELAGLYYVMQDYDKADSLIRKASRVRIDSQRP